VAVALRVDSNRLPSRSRAIRGATPLPLCSSVQLLSSAFGRVGDVYFQTGYFLRAGYLGFSEVQDPIHIQVEFPLSATAPDPLLVITAGIVVLANGYKTIVIKEPLRPDVPPPSVTGTSVVDGMKGGYPG
jgi:hypothetical protein